MLAPVVVVVDLLLLKLQLLSLLLVLPVACTIRSLSAT